MGTLRLYNFVYKNETKCSAEDGSVGERELVLDVDMAATGGGGRIEQNPGPVRFPCGSCDKAVQANQDGILCDGCEKWFHRKCIYMDREVYLQLGRSDDPWHCATCLLPAFRDSYFKDTRVIDISALTDTGTEDEMWNLSNTRKL